MEFKKYQHIERLGTTEVENIEAGTCYVFPKIDGTNTSVWLNEAGEIQAGSRKRQLTLDNDNGGFYAWVKQQKSILDYLKAHPTHRLFGEWLIPHSIKTYKQDAWRKFYVFDVAIDKTEDEILHEGDSKIKYLAYDTYQPLLEKHHINYIKPLAVLTNPSYDQLVEWLMKNDFLIEDGKGIGEGIVIKNYEFVNKYNRQTWAKIIASEFKQKRTKLKGGPKSSVEEQIAKKYVTKALCEKVKAKIELENNGFTSRDIPRLLHSIYYDIIREESWNFIKEHKNPTINYKTLQNLINAQVKEQLPKLF